MKKHSGFLAGALLLVGSVLSAFGQTTVPSITSTGITASVTLVPMYVPPIESNDLWSAYITNAFAVMTGMRPPDTNYTGWSNVVAATGFQPSLCSLGAAAPSPGRLAFAASVWSSSPGSSQISASMIYGKLASNDGNNNAFGVVETPSEYAPYQCVGRILGQDGNPDTWITNGPATQLVDVVYWCPGTANGFVANTPGDYQNITNYVGFFNPFTVTCTLYVIDGNGVLRAGGGVNGQGIARVSTQVPTSMQTFTLMSGSSEQGLLTAVNGSNFVYSIYSSSNSTGPFSQFVGFISTNSFVVPIDTNQPRQFFHLVGF